MSDLSQLPFDEYFRTLFLPAFWRLSREPASNCDAAFSRLVIFEAIDWLQLGVEIELYPAESAHKLLQEYGVELLEQCKLFPSQLGFLFPEHRPLVLQRIIKSTEIRPNRTFEASARLHTTVQTLTELVARANQDQSMRSLSTSLICLTDSSWERLLARVISSSEIMAILRSEGDLWIDGNCPFVHAGFFRSIQHLESSLELLDHIQRHAPIADWVMMRQTFKEVHGWRNNTRSAQFNTRIMQLATNLASILKAEFQAQGGTVESHMLVEYLRDLYRRWDGLEQPLVGIARA